LVPSFDGSDDLVGIFCPHKGLWVAVGVVDDAVDGFLKFLEGTEDAPLETRCSPNGVSSGAVAVGGQQDDLGPPDMLLRTVPIGDNPLQLGSVGGAQFDLGSFVHPPDSHDRVRRGILKRIETSDLAH
jgi:hypothetical protein